MNPKYWRTQVMDGKSTCPWCATINDHKTGAVCKHVWKVTVKDVVFYYWGIRPLPATTPPYAAAIAKGVEGLGCSCFTLALAGNLDGEAIGDPFGDDPTLWRVVLHDPRCPADIARRIRLGEWNPAILGAYAEDLPTQGKG